MVKARFQYLLDQYITGEISPVDRQELAKLLDDPQCVDLLDKEMRTCFFERIDSDNSGGIPAKMRSRLQERLPEHRFREAENKGTPGKWRSIGAARRWAAAAVLLAAIGSTWWLLHPRSKLPETTAKHVINDVAPGHRGAILTLANGSTMVLDSLGNGVIATQGNTEIKLKNGALLYNTSAGKNKVDNTIAYNTMTTPKGRQYQVVLPDGTKVWLNAASSLTYPTSFTGKERAVEITGEAYFEVKHNAAQPFKVKVDGQVIEDIGTAFNVNAYTDESSVNTTLLEGAVKIKVRDKTQLLSPGQQAQVNAGKASVKLIADADIAQAVAWKDGLFSFTDADIQTVMRQLARWYNVEVRYEGAIPKREFNGKIGKTLTLDQVLKVLTKTHVKYTIEEGNKITIMP